MSPGRKRPAEALMADSNQSMAERREIRRRQRDLNESIQDGLNNTNAVPQLQSQQQSQQSPSQRGSDEENVAHKARRDDASTFQALHKHQVANNALFRQVKYTRESVLDAENIELIVSKTQQEVEKLVQVARFDAQKLARKLRAKCTLPGSGGSNGSCQFQWTLLGRECGVCFHAIPSGVRFLAGSIDIEGTKVVRKARARNKQVAETAPEVRPEVMDKTKDDADALSAAEIAMKHLERKLKAGCKTAYTEKRKKHPTAEEEVLEEHGPEVDAVSFLFNPESFTQTVENIFNLGFLIKKGRASVGVRKQKETDEMRRPGLFVKSIPKDPTANGMTVQSTQAVVSFTMKDWKRIVEAHDLKECDLGHRTGSKHGRAQAPADDE